MGTRLGRRPLAGFDKPREIGEETRARRAVDPAGRARVGAPEVARRERWGG